jgi:hypothetical protein
MIGMDMSQPVLPSDGLWPSTLSAYDTPTICWYVICSRKFWKPCSRSSTSTISPLQYNTLPSHTLFGLVGMSSGSKRYAIIIPGQIVASIGSSG